MGVPRFKQLTVVILIAIKLVGVVRAVAMHTQTCWAQPMHTNLELFLHFFMFLVPLNLRAEHALCIACCPLPTLHISHRDVLPPSAACARRAVLLVP